MGTAQLFNVVPGQTEPGRWLPARPAQTRRWPPSMCSVSPFMKSFWIRNMTAGGSLLHRNDLLQRQPCAELRDIAAAGVAERAAQQRGVGGAG